MISYADMHEDMEPDLSQDAFGEDVIDSLETYDFDVEDDEDWDYVDDENVAATSSEDDTKKLMYPYDREEPQLTDEQMVELDGIADKIETQRLLSMGVLLNASCLDGTAYKQLSTRFVRTWRGKEMVIDGKPTRVYGSEDPDLLLESLHGRLMKNRACLVLQAVFYPAEFFL